MPAQVEAATVRDGLGQLPVKWHLSQIQRNDVVQRRTERHCGNEQNILER